RDEYAAGHDVDVARSRTSRISRLFLPGALSLDRGGRVLRQVRGERKARKSVRGAPQGRGSARMTRAKSSSQANVYRREKRRDGPVGRFLSALRERLGFSRPVLSFCTGLVIFVLVAALFAGGYVGRTMRSFDHGVNAVIDVA